jgi:hypothetical protein
MREQSQKAALDGLPTDSIRRDPSAPGREGTPGLLSRFRGILESIGLVIAPVTLIASLLYYFGWARTNKYYLHFGVDYSLLNFGTNDYLIRSIDAMFLPLCLLVVIGLVALQAHQSVVARFQGSEKWRRALRVMTFVGVALIAVGGLGLSPWPLFSVGIVEPSCLVLGAGIILYSRWIAEAIAKDHEKPGTPLTQWAMFIACSVALITIGLFWVVADYANVIGNARAEQLIRELPNRPDVVIYSDKRLAISAGGVHEERLTGTDGIYRYRYSGLKLLVQTKGRYFLLPSCWCNSNRLTVILPDRENLRFDVLPR